MPKHHFFATTAKGLEAIAAHELRRIGAGAIVTQTGGVAFAGDIETAYRANLWLRSAIRVLQPVAEFAAPTPELLYEHIRAIAWEERLTVQQTLAVNATVRDSPMTHSHYVALKTKDAIVDRFRDLYGVRPNVDTANPDMQIDIHIKAEACTVSLDMSGTSLHKRGYRSEGGVAPLNEALAAGIVQLTGYDGSQPFVDAMCGSGTLAIEAALLARRIAPGLLCREFGFQRWNSFDSELWRRLVDAARAEVLPEAPASIFAADISGEAVARARENARRAGVDNAIRFVVTDIRELRVGSRRGIVVCNPPYGERLGDIRELESLYRSIGAAYRRNFRGCTGYVFTGNLQLANAIGMKPKRRIALFNGAIESRLLAYRLA